MTLAFLSLSVLAVKETTIHLVNIVSQIHVLLKTMMSTLLSAHHVILVLSSKIILAYLTIVSDSKMEIQHFPYVKGVDSALVSKLGFVLQIIAQPILLELSSVSNVFQVSTYLRKYV